MRLDPIQWIAAILFSGFGVSAFAIGPAEGACPTSLMRDAIPHQSYVQTYPQQWLDFASLPSGQLYTDVVVSKRDQFSVAFNLIAEIQGAIRLGKLKIDFSGGPKVRFDEAFGGPDSYTYGLLRQLQLQVDDQIGYVDFMQKISDAARPVLTQLFMAKKLSYEEMWSTPHYQQLGQIPIQEHKIGVWVGRSGTARNAISQQWWMRPRTDNVAWWMNSSEYGSNITSETSLSPLREQKGTEREIHWLSKGYSAQRELDFSRMRVSVTRLREPLPQNRQGKTIGVEVLVNRAANEPPMGFYFNNFFGELVPSLKFDGKKIEVACIGCHRSIEGKMSFTPMMLNSEAQWAAVGYGARVIPFLMKAK